MLGSKSAAQLFVSGAIFMASLLFCKSLQTRISAAVPPVHYIYTYVREHSQIIPSDSNLRPKKATVIIGLRLHSKANILLRAQKGVYNIHTIFAHATRFVYYALLICKLR
jgi:hypothetical protein